MTTKYFGSHSTRLALIAPLLVGLLAIACSLTPVASKQAPQKTLPPIVTPQAPIQDWPTSLPPIPTNLPSAQPQQGTPEGSTTGGTINPCKLVTNNEVASLLGSTPKPDSRTNMPGDQACDFMVMTGLLSVNAATNPEAAAEFQLATAQFVKAPGAKSVQYQGVSIAVYGSDNADGNGTPGFTAYLNKGDLLVMIRLYSKTYTYNPDKAMALLQTIGGRLP